MDTFVLSRPAGRTPVVHLPRIRLLNFRPFDLPLAQMSIILLSLLGLLLVVPSSLAESPSCIAVYREGGAPAVFNSPKCPRWTFPSADDLLRRPPSPGCHVALRQGRRPYQEDRAVCVLDVKIPFLGKSRRPLSTYRVVVLYNVIDRGKFI